MSAPACDGCTVCKTTPCAGGCKTFPTLAMHMCADESACWEALFGSRPTPIPTAGIADEN